MGQKSLPMLLRWRSSTFFILLTLAIALFTDLFLYGLIVPILPFILEERIHVPIPEIQTYTSLLLAAYAGASGLSCIPIGIVADKLPARQTPFLVGLLALLGATGLLFVGRSIPVLVIARILQGISASVVWTVGLALVQDTVGSKKLGVTIGSLFSFISTGELTAPVLGGVLYKKAGYPGVFGLAFALLAIDFTLRIFVIEKKVAAKYSVSANEDDNTDSHASQIGTDEEGDEESPLLGGETESENWIIDGEKTGWIKSFPILYLLGDARFLTAQLVSFTQAFLLAAFDATIPITGKEYFDFTSLEAGLLFIPLVLPSLALGPIFGKGVDKYGPKPAAVFGMAYFVPVLVLSRLLQPGEKPEIIKFCVFVAFCGIGLGLISSISIVESSHVMEQYHKHNKGFFGEDGPYAQLYAIGTVFFNLGLTAGPVVAGGLRDKIGYGNMNAVVAGVCAITSLLSLIYVGGRPRFLYKE